MVRISAPPPSSWHALLRAVKGASRRGRCQGVGLSPNPHGSPPFQVLHAVRGSESSHSGKGLHHEGHQGLENRSHGRSRRPSRSRMSGLGLNVCHGPISLPPPPVVIQAPNSTRRPAQGPSTNRPRTIRLLCPSVLNPISRSAFSRLPAGMITSPLALPSGSSRRCWGLTGMALT